MDSSPEKDPPAPSTTPAPSQKRLEVIIAGSAVFVSLVNILATCWSNQNAQLNLLALDDRAMKERAAIRQSDKNLRLSDTRIAALERLQRAYSNLQSAYSIFIRDYCDNVILLTLRMIELENTGQSDPTAMDKANEAIARSSEKFFASSTFQVGKG